jgi:hypothetical protein
MANIKKAVNGMLDANTNLRKAKARDTVRWMTKYDVGGDDESSYQRVLPVKGLKSEESKLEINKDLENESAKKVLKTTPEDDFNGAIDLVRKKKSSKSTDYR